jgi:diaminopimelate decarboxylase
VEPALRQGLIQAAEQFGTPVYVYDKATILERCNSLREAVTWPKTRLLYAMKANSNREVLRTIFGAGFGVDCVSLAEILLAQKLGAPVMIYTNNNVSDEEFSAAVKLSNLPPQPSLEGKGEPNGKIFINCDSLQRLGDVPAGGSCFIRINGPVGGGHHDHVITCGPESKFGIPWEHVPQAMEIVKARGLKLIGVHQHIGSGVRGVDRFAQAVEILLGVLRHNAAPDLQYVNFGGGLGVPYKPGEKPLDLNAFGAMLTEHFGAFCKQIGKELTLMLEPGRFPIAEAGYLVAKVNTLKETPYGKTFAGIATGFNHLVRPTMYGSYHEISNLTNPDGPKKPYFVAGYICESGDIFTRGSGEENKAGPRALPELRRGDLIALHNAGAYGYVMASEYNLRPRPPEVMLDGGKLTLARRAKTFEEMAAEAANG